jgi:N-acetylmuramoyl-L-alanine amidase
MSSIFTTFRNALQECKQPGRAWSFLQLAAALALLSGCETAVRVKDTSRTFHTVVIDAGHGGHDLGTSSRWGGREKDDALDVALRVEPKLRGAGFHTVLTRNGDYFVPLGGRVRVSNSQSNSIFVSIHFNEAKSREPHGAETYYRSRCSREIAARVQNAVCALPGVSSRGVKTANYWVLRRNGYPAVLVECGFLSNPSEACRCASPQYREMLASAIAGAIIQQRGGNLSGPVVAGN